MFVGDFSSAHVSDTTQLKGGGRSTASLSSGVSPLLKTRLSSSHPDLSSLQLLPPDDRPDYPEHCPVSYTHLTLPTIYSV